MILILNLGGTKSLANFVFCSNSDGKHLWVAGFILNLQIATPLHDLATWILCQACKFKEDDIKKWEARLAGDRKNARPL